MVSSSSSSTELMSHDALMGVLKAVCLASGAAMHLAPIPTMREITAARSTLNFHIAPYASTLLNHSVNLWYAIIRGDLPLIVHRIAGISAQTYYLSTYTSFSHPSKAADNRRWIVWIFGILAAIFVFLHMLLPLAGQAAQYNAYIAIFGAITGVGLAAAPLATVVSAARTRVRAASARALLSPVSSSSFPAARGTKKQGRVLPAANAVPHGDGAVLLVGSVRLGEGRLVDLP
jgi:Sugar efflux transporter for intercellular exchange